MCIKLEYVRERHERAKARPREIRWREDTREKELGGDMGYASVTTCARSRTCEPESVWRDARSRKPG